MCGIWAYLFDGDDIEYSVILNNFMSIKGRGPDNMNVSYQKNKYLIGFHRLSIMDTTTKGNQPFIYYDNDIKYTCICNGEIYNANKLKEDIKNYKFKSTSDCEVLIPLFIKKGYDMVNYLDGVFGFMIIKEENDNIEVFIARDKIGIRPIFYGKDISDKYLFCSELKGIKDLAVEAEQFNPGHYMVIKNGIKEKYERYYTLDFDIPENFYDSSNMIVPDAYLKIINDTLTSSVQKRLLSDRPVCALLSGGLDSSLVCSIASRLLKEKDIQLHTFSIGMPGCTDIEYAQKVADFIKSKHTVINISINDAISAIRDVIWTTETYDITTIRASTGQYLISKYISENSDYKVILSGDGSDEVTSGYLENFMAPNLKELHEHSIKRISEIHYYDVLRADRATSIHGLELRVPFLDPEFVKLYTSFIEPKYRQPTKERSEKWLLRKSFEGYLPEEVLWRQKEAFSDGISSIEDSWYTIIQRMCDKIVSDDELSKAKEKYPYCTPISKESYYFREVYTEMFGNKYNKIIPSFWMPEWSNTNDPSARTLNVYNNKEEELVEKNI